MAENKLRVIQGTYTKLNQNKSGYDSNCLLIDNVNGGIYLGGRSNGNSITNGVLHPIALGTKGGTINGSLTINGGLTVSDNACFNNSIHISAAQNHESSENFPALITFGDVNPHPDWWYGSDDSLEDGPEVYIGEVSDTHMTIHANGNIYLEGGEIHMYGPTGVNSTLSVASTLSVGSTLSVTGKINARSDVSVNGKVDASGGFFETSDKTLKNFKSDIKIDFDSLSKLPKKYFTWKEDATEQLHIGTSAQDVQQLFPELVSENDGVLSVDYAKLSIIALAAIDKLNERIEYLEKQLNK